jgi:hypothetical protein
VSSCFFLELLVHIAVFRRNMIVSLLVNYFCTCSGENVMNPNLLSLKNPEDPSP